MTLSRWRRVATGVAAGVIVLCAALLGGSFRDDGGDVSVASDLRADDTAAAVPENVIEIPEEAPEDTVEADEPEDGDSDVAADVEGAGDAADADAVEDDGTDSVTVIEADDLPEPSVEAEPEAEATAEPEPEATAVAEPEATAAPAVEPTAVPTAAVEAPITADDDALGTGGGVDDAECALDRLVIYAGARRGGVAGSIRNALAQAGFGVGCPTPVTVLASNCPLQFAGVLGTGSGYDPLQSFVASSSSVDRESMTAVLGAVGYTGAEINILDFGFVNPDKPGEQWIAIFIPPSFAGWEQLAGRAGLSPTTSSLCSASGQLVG